jgi:phenylalanine-4-hydroxylase
MVKNMNSSHEKIGMRLNTIDDINFYEWYAAETSYQIIFVGGAFVTIQTYFDFLDHISLPRPLIIQTPRLFV